MLLIRTVLFKYIKWEYGLETESKEVENLGDNKLVGIE